VLLLLLAEHIGRWADERRPQEVSRHPPHSLLLLLLLLLAVVVVVVETALLLLLEVVVVVEPMLFLLQLVLLILLAVVRLLRLRVARGSRRCEMVAPKPNKLAQEEIRELTELICAHTTTTTARPPPRM